jgi:hypothetical protein
VAAPAVRPWIPDFFTPLGIGCSNSRPRGLGHQQNDPGVHPGQMGRCPQWETSPSRLNANAGDIVAFAYDIYTTTNINLKSAIRPLMNTNNQEFGILCFSHNKPIQKYP